MSIERSFIKNYKNMTPEEEKQVIKIYGINYEESDIPAYIRERDEKEFEKLLKGSWGQSTVEIV